AVGLRDSRHLFLRQSLLVDRLNGWLDTRSGWPPFVVALARSWLTADLRDRCITRDLAWGVPVPRPGFEHKVFYVWFDAPIAYIAATRDWAAERPCGRDWRDWWWDVDDVRYGRLARAPSRLGGAGEARRGHQGIPLAHLRGRQVLDQPPARHLYRRGARGAARGSLALVADRQRARDGRHGFHPAALRRRRK